MITIAICVCTYKRPKMLAKCFSSLINQDVLADWNIVFIIVDNEAGQENRELVEGFKKLTSYSVHYAHQPKRGRSAARNTALDVSLKQKADWICFFDDDQYTDKGAIKAAFLAAQRYEAEVVNMSVHYVLEHTTTHYLHEARAYKEGEILTSSGTGGVLFRSSLASPSGLGLHFDENLGLFLHEDIDFFSKASSMGKKIVRSTESVVYETKHPERLSIRYECLAQLYNSSDKFSYHCKNKRYLSLLGFLLKLPFQFLAPLEITAFPVYLLIFNINYLKLRFVKICMRVAWGTGGLSAIFNIDLEKYKIKTIAGN